MIEIILPVSLFAIGFGITDVRNFYKSSFNTIKTAVTDAMTNINMGFKACMSGIINYNVVKDYALHRARTISSNHLNNGKLVYDDVNKIYKLTYFKESNEYTLIFKRSARGPRNVRLFIDEHGKNVTKEIVKTMGITKDFHQIPTTPKMLGYKSLKLTYITGVEYEFGENDILRLSPPNHIDV